MTRTAAAASAALPKPNLRPTHIPELEGNRLRLYVERKVFGGRVGREIGSSWLFLSPSGHPDAHDGEAQVTLPLDQAEALERACAAFNAIMDGHERGGLAVAA